ncbi:retrovirus-related pol polyprotein from transposon TNT 1-94 [Tanacetum coccineum]
MSAPRVRDVYVLEITSFAQESCFFAKASDNLNWLWHKRLAHLNFKTINKLAKLVIGLPSLAFRVFNIRRQQTEETYHIIFDESPDAIKFSKPSVDDINIAETERYPPDECLHPYEPSQRYQTNRKDVSFIKPYECPELVVLETKSEHSNHTNDEQIIDNIPNTEYIQIFEHLSSLSVEDTSVQNTIPILNPSLSILSMVTPAPKDRWCQDKHIELVNIISNLRAGMLTRAMAKELSAASAHECLFVDFLSKEEPKKVSEALQHPGWVDVMQDELN